MDPKGQVTITPDGRIAIVKEPQATQSSRAPGTRPPLRDGALQKGSRARDIVPAGPDAAQQALDEACAKKLGVRRAVGAKDESGKLDCVVVRGGARSAPWDERPASPPAAPAPEGSRCPSCGK